jgi:SAM-dependent methyltransferase
VSPLPLDEAAYFAPQRSKSDRKIAVQYRRLFAKAGLQGSWPEGPALDLGCGAGPGLRYFASRGARPYGADRSHYALQEARALVPASRLVRTDALLSLPFRDEAFALVLASELIEHLADGRPFLRECRRVLRPGGVLVLTTPNLWDVRRFTSPLLGRTWSGYADPTHVNLYDARRLRREMGACGFARARVRTGWKPLLWLPPHRDPWPIPYPPFVGNGIVALGQR